MKNLILVLSLIVMQPPVSAASEADPLCPDAVTTRDMEQCVAAEFQKSEKLLDRYLAEAARQVANSAEARRSLETAQAAWRKYRDAQCQALHAVYAPGSVAGLQLVSCRLELTQVRTHELWATYIENRVSDLGEPEK